MEQIKKWLVPDTLIKKCVYAICGTAAVLFMVISVLIGDWAYYLLKPQFQHTYSVLTSSVATQISYILHQNTQYLLKFAMNKELLQNIRDFEEELSSGNGEAGLADQLYDKIVDSLAAESYGDTETGAIISTRKGFVVEDWKYRFCSEEMAPYAQTIMDSAWYKTLPETLDSLAKTYGVNFPRCYTAVFEGDSQTEEFIAYAARLQRDDHTYLFVMVEPFSEFRALFKDFSDADIEDFVLIGYEGQILFSNSAASVFSRMTAEDLEGLFLDGQYELNLVEQGEDSIIAVRLSYRIEDLKMAIRLSKQDLLRPYQSFFGLTNKVLLIFTIVLVAVIILILRTVLGRVRQLAGQMQEVKKGNYQVSRCIHGRDEVAMLADTFYQMMDEIQSNLDTIQKQEERKQQIEYSLLVSQIDPHFIYNTLYTITYLAKLNRTEDIMVINRALTGMLRDRLRISRLQIFDTIEKEREQVYDYITIQKYLCSNAITLEFVIEENCEGIQYPKNVLQPFVENSILHGIVLHRDGDGKRIPGVIRISVSREKGQVMTEICDNGIGMSREQMDHYFGTDLTGQEWSEDSTQGHEHIGIFNIRMRMSYLYGEKFRISADVAPEGGLIIRFWLPAVTGQSEVKRTKID